jgi:hypothetical protein
MAEFYSTTYGNRGTATRCGSKASGIHSSVQSWEGSIATALYVTADGTTYARIVVGSGSTASPLGRTIYNGPLADLINGED